MINKNLIDLLKIKNIDCLVLEDAVDPRILKIQKNNHILKIPAFIVEVL